MTVLLSGAFGIGVTLTTAMVGRGAGDAEVDVDAPGEEVALTVTAEGSTETLELGNEAAVQALSMRIAAVSARAARNLNTGRR